MQVLTFQADEELVSHIIARNVWNRPIGEIRLEFGKYVAEHYSGGQSWTFKNVASAQHFLTALYIEDTQEPTV